ncbi:hypothetical protein I4U23_027152 [Adineta vaga]|nr:hypothetical protein I4U23_027152 [Adineta vaga]
MENLKFNIKLDETCQPTFKPSAERLITHDARTRQAAVGDLNNDGYLDIVVVNSGTDSIGIFIGYGNGMFASQITQSTGLNSRPYSVAVGNFNNDSLLDIAIANYDTHSVGVIFGYGLAITDIDNNDLMDIIVANYDADYVEILLQKC